MALESTKNIRRCYVIGNGHSRQHYDIDHLAWPKFGCNQIYKDHKVDYLCAQDKDVLHQMQQDRVTQTVYLPALKWRSFRHNSWTQLPSMEPVALGNDIMASWLTGEIAIMLAAQKGFDRIILIGFDGGPDSWYRERTKTDQSLQVCQSRPERYEHSFAKIKKTYPHIIIEPDEYFLQAYK
jgi:hypothetical protein